MVRDTGSWPTLSSDQRPDTDLITGDSEVNEADKVQLLWGQRLHQEEAEVD